MINLKARKLLRKQLPAGSAAVIRKRIKEKYPDMPPFSTVYINKCLDPMDTRQNSIILEVAIEYRDELLKEQARLNEKILEPNL